MDWKIIRKSYLNPLKITIISQIFQLNNLYMTYAVTYNQLLPSIHDRYYFKLCVIKSFLVTPTHSVRKDPIGLTDTTPWQKNYQFDFSCDIPYVGAKNAYNSLRTVIILLNAIFHIWSLHILIIKSIDYHIWEKNWQYMNVSPKYWFIFYERSSGTGNGPVHWTKQYISSVLAWVNVCSSRVVLI